MEIKKTSDIKTGTVINLLLYGEPKVGKSTFATTAKDVLICDAESGYNFFGAKGVSVPLAQVSTWDDMKEFYKEASKPEYKTIVIDPVGELLEKLLLKAKTNRMYVQSTDPSALSMKGWGFVKDTMRQMLKSFRDLNKNVIFVAHVKNIEDDGVLKKTPKLDANLSGELMSMMDLIGYMFVIADKVAPKRVITFKATNKYDAGDRSDTLPEFFNPNDGFDKISEIVLKNPKFIYKKEVDSKNKENLDAFSVSLDASKPIVPKQV